MPSWRTMSSTQKAFTVAGATVVGVLALYWLLSKRADRPIIIGDSSVTFDSDAISKNSDTELEVRKFLHKVRTITVVDTTNGTLQSTTEVQGYDWTLTSASGLVVISTDPQLLGLQAGVKGDCPTAWQGGGTLYTCVPADGSKLTPATLKIQGQNCPSTGQPTCMLACTSGKCQISLEYR